MEDPEFHDLLDDVDRRALSPLFWSHVNPYGWFRFDMDTRLDFTVAAASDTITPPGAEAESVL